MAAAAEAVVPPSSSMAFDLCMGALNHGSTSNATHVQSKGATIATMVETTWNRLEPALRERGWGVAELARQMGVSYQAIKKVEMGGDFGRVNNIKAAKLFGFNSDWLATGKGPQYSNDIRTNVEAGPDLREPLPLISWVAAGRWDEAVDNFAPGDAEDWIPCIRPHSKRSYALRVKGDSMTAPHGNTRTYPEGSIIFVDPERRSPVNGDRIIAKLEGSAEVTFKVFKEEDGRRWLMPLNPAHEPIRDHFKVIGTVIGKWEDE